MWEKLFGKNIGGKRMWIKHIVFHHFAEDWTDPDTGEIHHIDASDSIAQVLVDKDPIRMKLWQWCNSSVALRFRKSCLDFFFPVHIHTHAASGELNGWVSNGDFMDTWRVRRTDSLGLFASKVDRPMGGWIERTNDFDECDCRRSHPCAIHQGMRVLDCHQSESVREPRWGLLLPLKQWANGGIAPSDMHSAEEA